MNKIKNFLMLMAVVIAVTGAFAFNTNNSTKSPRVAGATTASQEPTSSSGGTLVFPPGTTFTDISGLVKGTDFVCDLPEKLCYFIKGTGSTTTTDANGNVIVTNVTFIDNTGQFRLI